MTGADPIAQLIHLVQAAAEAGEDWRGELHRTWLPSMVAGSQRADILVALAEWAGEAVEPGAEVESLIESTVLAVMASEGYD